jgi:hypothetical protein
VVAGSVAGRRDDPARGRPVVCVFRGKTLIEEGVRDLVRRPAHGGPESMVGGPGPRGQQPASASGPGPAFLRFGLIRFPGDPARLADAIRSRLTQDAEPATPRRRSGLTGTLIVF